MSGLSKLYIGNYYTMNTKIQNITYVDGQDVATISAEDLLFKVQTVEQEIENLKKVKSESKTVKAMIVKHEDNLAKLVEILDTKKV